MHCLKGVVSTALSQAVGFRCRLHHNARRYADSGTNCAIEKWHPWVSLVPGFLGRSPGPLPSLEWFSLFRSLPFAPEVDPSPVLARCLRVPGFAWVSFRSSFDIELFGSARSSRRPLFGFPRESLGRILASWRPGLLVGPCFCRSVRNSFELASYSFVRFGFRSVPGGPVFWVPGRAEEKDGAMTGEGMTEGWARPGLG